MGERNDQGYQIVIIMVMMFIVNMILVFVILYYGHTVSSSRQALEDLRSDNNRELIKLEDKYRTQINQLKQDLFTSQYQTDRRIELLNDRVDVLRSK